MQCYVTMYAKRTEWCMDCVKYDRRRHGDLFVLMMFVDIALLWTVVLSVLTLICWLKVMLLALVCLSSWCSGA